MAPPRRSKDCVLEGGKYYLAEALHDTLGLKIRCPSCPGNLREPGFIRDHSGKGGLDGRARRSWTCQLSNSRRNNGPRCSRATCTEYINLAIRQLDQSQFTEVLKQVCQRFPPERDDYAALRGYTNIDTSLSMHPSTPASSLASQDLPQKRKAEEELPVRDKTTRHAQIQGRRETSGTDTSTLQSAVQHLESLLEISKTWEKQHQMLTIFLASSNPPQQTPSSETPSWPSPNLAPERVFSSDATIPCTDPEDELSSSPPNPSSESTKSVKVDLSSSMSAPPSKSTGPVRVYVGAAVFKRSYDSTRPTQAKSSSPPAASSSCPTPPTDIHSSPPIPPVKLSSDPMDRVRDLVHQFQQAKSNPITATAKRRAIRQQARAEGLLASFQSLLKQDLFNPNPERKCSERT
ncbi:MAG: hypothetical protein MMC33_010906 [Icmadophila ericetorum]|nr:hypothetical protein [Icmadophila ericetorum]